MKIYCNNHKRTIIYGWELPDKIRPDFDWLDDILCSPFVKYRNQYYSLDEFMHFDDTNIKPDHMKNFDGYAGNSFFSGVLIKLLDDENCIMATYIE